MYVDYSLANSSSDAKLIRAKFGMERHPIAGWISPHYSDSEIWGRSSLSAMYHLIEGDEPMPEHKLTSTEVWNFYLGAPIEFVVTDHVRMHQTTIIGSNLDAGEQLQFAIPAHFWKSCRSLGAWSLLGCTMSPGYSPRTFLMLGTAE